jgi:zinc transporter, ZIP family
LLFVVLAGGPGAAAIAVLSHDFADRFNTYTITSLSGNDRRRALALLVADAFAPVTGAAITLLVTRSSGSTSGFSPASSSICILRHPSCRRS